MLVKYKNLKQGDIIIAAIKIKKSNRFRFLFTKQDLMLRGSSYQDVILTVLDVFDRPEFKGHDYRIPTGITTLELGRMDVYLEDEFEVVSQSDSMKTELPQP